MLRATGRLIRADLAQRPLQSVLTGLVVAIAAGALLVTLHLRAVLDEPFDDLLGKVGLQDRRKHRPSELSGGQQQRVAIARALVSRPSVVFADEPTGNLDSRTGGEILDLLRGSVHDYGQTLVMVTHDARAAATADRILFIADGLIVKELHGADEHQVLAAVEEIALR